MGKPPYALLRPDEQHWRKSNIMKIPNTNLATQLDATQLGMRLWRLPPKSAMTCHRHVIQEEIYYVLEGTGRIRIGDESVTVPRGGAVLVQPAELRQPFNDTDEEVLWLVAGAPWSEFEHLPQDMTPGEYSYPRGMQYLPPELTGVEWPPTDASD